MKRKLQITEEILKDELNKDVVFKVEAEDPEGSCPADTSEGYYVKSAGQCVFVRYS